MKRLALVTAAVLGIALSAFVLWKLRTALVLFLLSLVVAAVMRPPVDRLEEAGLPRGLALAAVYGAVIAAVLGVVGLVAAPLAAELRRSADEILGAYHRLRATGPLGSAFRRLLLDQMPSSQTIYQSLADGGRGRLAGGLLSATRGVFDVLGASVAVVAMSAYWTARRLHFERIWLSLVPAASRSRARDVFRTVEQGLGAHLRGEAAHSLLALVTLAVGFGALDMRYPVMPALAAAVVRLVPIVGPPAGVVAAFLSGWAVSLPLGIAAGAFALAVLAVLQRLFARWRLEARRASPLLTLLVMVALADAYGPGALPAASTLALGIALVFEGLSSRRAAPVPAGASLRDLDDRVAAVRQRLGRADWEGPSEIGRAVERLGALVQEARRTAL